MWLYLLSILTVCSVQSLTITYPYRPLVTYEPVRTQILDKSSPAQAFLVYLDNNGIERIVAYNYAEPVYAIRRISYINSITSAVQTLTTDDSSDDVKAREAHFRAWSLHQYQILKHEIDLLKAEGKEPSIEMKLKFLPLEKIALTPDFSTIADSPEVQRIRLEHLNIWKQIDKSTQSPNKENSHNYFENLNPPKAVLEDSLTPKPLINESTVEDFKNVEIMQILNGDKSVIEQLKVANITEELKNVEPEFTFANKIGNDKKIPKYDSLETKETNPQIKDQTKTPEEIASTTAKIDEEKPQTTEESKGDLHSNMKIEKPLVENPPFANLKPQQLLDVPEIASDINKTNSELDEIKKNIDETISIVTEPIPKSEDSVSELPSPLNITQLLSQEIDNISEIVKEIQTNFTISTKIESETTTSHQIIHESEKQIEEQINNVEVINQTFAQEPESQNLNTAEIVKTTEKTVNLALKEQQGINAQKKVQTEVEKIIAAAPRIYVPQQVVDTAEVVRHRNEHLRIVKEALEKAKLAREQHQQSKITTEFPSTVKEDNTDENSEVIQKANN